MSDVFVEEEVQQLDPTAGGQVVEVDGAEAEQEVPLLELDQYGNYKVPVKVDGEEQFVPLAEAVAGFQRQADYTRKTQELAQQRNELGFAAAIKAALEQDPHGTIQLLASHYGVTQQQAAQMVATTAPTPTSEADPWYEDDGWGAQRTDPMLSSIAERLARIEQANEHARLRGEVQRLQNTYPDFNPQEVVAHAIRMGTTDLEAAYKQVAFDRIVAENRQLQAAVAHSAAQRQAKQAASVVAGGVNSSPSGLDDVGEIHSIVDAYAAAKRQFGA